MKRIAVPAALLPLILAVAACGSSEPETETQPGTSAEGIEVEVSDAWVAAPIGNSTVTGAFMKVTNSGGEDVKLVSATVDPATAAAAQLHETTMAEAGESGAETTTTAQYDVHGGGSGSTHGGGSGDTAGMAEVEAIEIPAGETVSLERGSYHLMLIDLAAPLSAGATVPITLTFEDTAGQTEEVRVDAEVRAA